MSFHFYVPAIKPITYRQILDRLENKKAAIAWQDEYDLTQKAESARFYIPGKSSRGIRIYLENGNYDISINVLSSGEDNALAADLAVTLASLMNTDIKPEDTDEPMSIEIFKSRFDAGWVEWHKKSGLSSVDYFIHDPKNGGTISFDGCFRKHYIGKKLLARLKNDDPGEDTLYDRIIENIRLTQFIDEEKFRIPGIYSVSEKDGNPKWEYVVVAPDNNFFLPKTEYLILFMEKDNRLKIPYADIHRLADHHFQLVDEEQYFVSRISENDFLLLMEKARQLKPSPDEPVIPAKQKKPAKKGWKFWKKG